MLDTENTITDETYSEIVHDRAKQDPGREQLGALCEQGRAGRTLGCGSQPSGAC